jgi:cobalt-zinc-cadmium efflux system outer membrane protein
MNKSAGLMICGAMIAGLSGCAPSPLDESYWATQRPLGASLEVDKPPREIDEAERQARPPEEPKVPGVTGELSLRDALAAALRGNPSLSRFGYEVRAAEAEVVQAGLWPNPELDAEFEDFAGTGDLEGVDALEVTLALSQTFPLGGDIEKRQELAQQQGRLAGWDYEAARIALLSETTGRYVDVLAAQRQVELGRESLKLAEQVADSIGRRVDAGDAPAVERSRAAVPVATARIALRRAERLLETARVQLALTWGSSSPAFDSVTGDLDRMRPLPPISGIAALIGQNPDVARWVTEIASRQAEVELARAEAVPDLTAGLGYRWFNETDDSALVAGVSIPLPVFDRRQGDILAGRFGVAAARNQQRAVELEVEAAVAAAYARLANAYDEALALRDTAIPPATEAYNDIRQAFDRGNLGFLDVLEAERTLIDLREQYVNALAEYHGAAAELEGLIGQSLDTVGTPNVGGPPSPSDPNSNTGNDEPKDTHDE